MERLNPKQVEWLVVYQPETEHEINYLGIRRTKSFFRFFNCDISHSKSVKDVEYYLTPETYNSLPTEFKQLADATT